jgi:hypothetical protein
MKHDLASISRAFDTRADFLSAEPYGSGHINDTYAAHYRQGGTPIRYIHQRINHHVFRDPVTLMANVERVTGHLRNKLMASGADDMTRRALTLVPAVDGRPFYQDPDGNTWRTYVFIENARTYDQIESTVQAYEAARAFGEFQKQLRDLPGERLVETIPGFHDTRSRFNTLRAAIEADP